MNPSDGSCVYIVHAVETLFYKIGMTTKIKSRLASFHSVAPFIVFDPVLIYYHEDRMKIENQLHKRFQDQRIEGTEWFKLDEINFEYLKQDIDVIANDLDCQKRTNKIYPVISQREKSKKIKKPLKSKYIKKKEKIIIEGVKWENGVPTNKLYSGASIEEEFEYGLLPEIEWLYENLGSWKAVADYYGVDVETIWKIANFPWMPIDDLELRHKLGLSGLSNIPFDERERKLEEMRIELAQENTKGELR
jgi:hypothetical protein